jgi:transposase
MPPPDLHDLSYAEMKALVAGLLGRVAELTRTVAELREENVRLNPHSPDDTVICCNWAAIQI